MAELVAGAFLSSSFQVTFEMLASVDVKEYFSRNKLDWVVEKLRITLDSINQVQDEAENKQYQSKPIKEWLDALKHLVYEADQILDEIATDVQLDKLKGESEFSTLTNRFESRIKELLEKLEFLAKQKETLGLKGGTCASNEGGVSWKSSNIFPTTSLVDESSIYGRDGEKEEIIEFLLSDNHSGNQVPIISIEGLGGTTLAQLVYNDQRMQGHFELKARVYVSESFDVVGLTKAILRSFQFSADGEELDPLQRQLQQRLIGKKYLLVLDDVWNPNGECWERLLLPFNHGSSGSKIIVTTRNKEVAFLSSFFDVIFEKLASVDFIDYFRRGKLERLGGKLELTLNSINQVLDDAEKKQYERQDVKKWLGDVKHSMYEADQLLDEIATDAQLKKLKVESQPATSSIVSGFISAFSNPFESRIKELLKNLDSLAEQKDRLGLKRGTCARNEVRVSWKPSKRLPTTSLVDESDIYGREADKEKTIKFLLADNDNSNQVPIISIAGLGGMGKTTLAQLVYNDQRMQKHFELKAWVYVSEFFDVVGLTKAILRSFQFSADGEELDPLQHQLQQRLIGKKYLLVLDDVWSPNGEFWERLLLPFNHGSSGSKIIVTTRNKEVVSVMKSTQLLHLQQLEESNCWNLFVRHAFHDKNVSEYPNLESIGKKIVDKCGGLPLAVKSLGNLLQRKFSQSEWLKILETDLWCLSDGDSNINPVLRLSYLDLPSHLKRCFAFCSIFPKGNWFEKNEIIKLWMGEGLLKCHRVDKSEEELGYEFFDDLESISFFQQALRSDQFVMHDLVNDLAKSVSGEFCYRIEGDRVHDIPERTRHIWCSLDLNDGDRRLEHIYKIKGLRSLIVQPPRGRFGAQLFKISNNVQHDMFSRLKYLRMLSFSCCNLTELADEISYLKLLHYLDLSRTEITSLPDSICMLYNLQTLLLQSCFNLTELPSDFCKLVNLRHLDMSGTGIKKMPKHIGRLNHLQTLTPNFVVGEHNGSDIVNYCGSSFPNWLGVCHLANLVSLTLVACQFCSQLPPLGQLPSLKKLSISFCDGIEFIGPEFYGNNSSNVPFRSLEILQFEDMSSWKEWLCLEGFPLLEELSISCCPKLKSSLPQNLPSLQILDIFDCQELEASIPKAASISELNLQGCENILVTESPSSLKCAFLGGNRVIESSLEKILFNNAFLEELDVRDFSSANLECFSLDLHCYNSLRILSITGWCCSSLPSALHLLPNLHSLKLHDCPELESFPGEGFPSSLSRLEIYNCPELIASREKWGLFKLNSLKEFVVSDDFENVESFPEESLLPPTLNHLKLERCSKLRLLNYKGLLHLKSLKSLTIEYCPCLERLPEEGLPYSLSTLDISLCPLLKQQYQKEEGERWNTIQHIPSVRIY